MARLSHGRLRQDGVTLGRASSVFSLVLPRNSAIIRPESTSNAAEPRSRRSVVCVSSVLPFDQEVPLTSFEQHCLGSPFCRMFKDCGDFAYVCYRRKHCTSVEALLLTGYVFYGKHIYQASSIVLLLLARLLPRKLLRTFNVLLIRWYVDPERGIVSPRAVLHLVPRECRALLAGRSDSCGVVKIEPS